MRLRLTGAKNCCPTCGAYFRNNRAFDDHRVGDYGANRRCLTELEMFLLGMSPNDDGFWRDASKGKPPLQPALYGHETTSENNLVI